MLPRLRIRHLMILIVYVAVTLTVMLAASDKSEPRLFDVIGASIVLPLVLSSLSVLLLRPGPSRDWVVAFFWTIFQGLLAILFAAPTLLVIFMYRRLNGPVGPIKGAQLIVPIISFYGLLCLGLAVRQGRLYLIPAQCPRCERKRLLRAVLSGIASNWPLYYVRCGICDRRDRLYVSRIREGCPTCHRPTFILIRYRFYWCLECRSRFKRLRRGDWEDASSPEDDGWFLLWSLSGSLRTLINRIVKKGRTPGHDELQQQPAESNDRLPLR
jgi:hypothetical protein